MQKTNYGKKIKYSHILVILPITVFAQFQFPLE